MSWGNTPEAAQIAPVSIDELTSHWNNAQANMKYWQEQEMQLRLQLVKLVFDNSKEKGTEHHGFTNGWTLTCVKKLSYKLDPEKTDEVLNSFSLDLAAMLVKWSPELSLTNYNLLNEEGKALFAGILTVKPATPTLTLVPPKVKP